MYQQYVRVVVETIQVHQEEAAVAVETPEGGAGTVVDVVVVVILSGRFSLMA
jgi:hypothetical protein